MHLTLKTVPGVVNQFVHTVLPTSLLRLTQHFKKNKHIDVSWVVIAFESGIELLISLYFNRCNDRDDFKTNDALRHTFKKRFLLVMCQYGTFIMKVIA